MKQKIPKWILDPNDQQLCEEVDQIFRELKDFVGKPLREVTEEIEGINISEKKESIRKLRREIAEYISESFENELPNNLSPADIRKYIFSSLWDKGQGFITSASGLFMPTSDEIFGNAENYFNLEPKIVEKLFFADIPEEKLLKIKPELNAADPGSIIRAINSRRLKWKLRKSIGLKLIIPVFTEKNSPYTSIIWSLKKCHLMYDAVQIGNDIVFNVTGPYGLFMHTTIYGNRLAQLIEMLVQETLCSWKVHVDILNQKLAKTKSENIETVLLDNSMSELFASKRDVTEQFKSSDEEAFMRYITKYSSDLDVSYEGTIIPLKSEVGKHNGFFIPDFVLQNRNKQEQILIEIVGYWREEYLQRKIEKIKLLRDRNLILIVNRNLGLSSADGENVLSELEFVKIYYYSSRAELKNVARSVVAELDGGNN
ncbi:MAG: DUF790 family protein [Bacteroidota bacterium]|nr:DUF790 family protein [Bacteroidota bacterium]